MCSCESQTDRKEPVHSGKTPSAPLSPTAHRLLTEFGLRYGVVSVCTRTHVVVWCLVLSWCGGFSVQGELYRRIVYLEYLAK